MLHLFILNQLLVCFKFILISFILIFILLFIGNVILLCNFSFFFVSDLFALFSLISPDGSSGESACEGRVVVSYDKEEERTRQLAIVYQSIIIGVTIGLGGIFFYYSYQVFQSAKKMASSKQQFVIVVGGTFTIAFLIRSILFLIILVADFASSIYMFITLFLTEVLMMTFLLIQFNQRQFAQVAVIASTSKSMLTSRNSSTTIDGSIQS